MAIWHCADLGDNATLLCQDSTCAVYKLVDDTGEGVRTCYPVLPGVWLLYHDFHMEHCLSGFQPATGMFCIDHCREGRLEWSLNNATCMYMESGDMLINARDDPRRHFRFPLRHYHGLTIAISPDEINHAPTALLDGFPLDIYALRQKFSQGGHSLIMRAGMRIEHIFSELYDVPESIRAPLFRIKVLELLLFLNTVDAPAHAMERPYFHKTHVEKAKEIMALMTAHPERHYTLNELSARFSFPLTAMKACFKGVYGVSIYAYMKKYRMSLAAVQLRKTDQSVTGIAQKLGYDNASKFASAFKSILRFTPGQYRRLRD